MLQDILNSLASSTTQSGSGQAQSGNDMLSSVLGSLLSGSQTGNTTSTTQNGGDELSSLIGSVLGGMSNTTSTANSTSGQTSSNPLLDLVSSGQNSAVNSLIQPVVDQVATKIGVDPQLAMAAATFAVHYLLTNHGSTIANGGNLSNVLDQHTNQDYLQSSGLSKTFASQNGVSTATAANTLSEVFKLLGAN
jgi:hypothetical protein